MNRVGGSGPTWSAGFYQVFPGFASALARAEGLKNNDFLPATAEPFFLLAKPAIIYFE